MLYDSDRGLKSKFFISNVYNQTLIQYGELKNELLRFNKSLERNVHDLTNQQDIAIKTKIKKKYPKIFKVYETHHGLCDLLCNYFTIMKPDDLNNLSKVANIINDFQSNGAFNLQKMENLSRTHVLSLVGFIELVLFLFLKIIPNSLLTYAEQEKLRKQDPGLDHSSLLYRKFNGLAVGKIIKFVNFNTKYGLPDQGHSMLLSKMGEDSFFFYNPDKAKPECEFYNTVDLLKKIKEISKVYRYTSFIDNDEFMKRVDKNLFRGIEEKPFRPQK